MLPAASIAGANGFKEKDKQFVYFFSVLQLNTPEVQLGPRRRRSSSRSVVACIAFMALFGLSDYINTRSCSRDVMNRTSYKPFESVRSCSVSKHLCLPDIQARTQIAMPRGSSSVGRACSTSLHQRMSGSLSRSKTTAFDRRLLREEALHTALQAQS